MQLPVAPAHAITSGTPTQHPHKCGLSCAYILLPMANFQLWSQISKNSRNPANTVLDALKSSTKSTTTQPTTEATKPVPDQPNDFPSLPTREVSIWDPRPTVSSILSRNGASSSRVKVRVPSPVRVSNGASSSRIKVRVPSQIRVPSPVRSRVSHTVCSYFFSSS
jgi:hypothetical protein